MSATTRETVTEIYGNDLNHWLAAVGITQVIKGARLSWRGRHAPAAVIHGYTLDDLVEAVAAGLPTREELDRLPLARYRDGLEPLTLNPTVTAAREREALAQTDPSTAWTWNSLYAIAEIGADPAVLRAPMLTPMPGVSNTPWDRLVAMVDHITPDAVRSTLVGDARRVRGFGLGIDISRFPAEANDGDMTIDPVMDTLAFHALALFPMRASADGVPRQRGWTGNWQFRWPNWAPALTIHGIDALLDMWAADSDAVADDVTWAWESVRRARVGKSSNTGFGSRPIPRRHRRFASTGPPG